MNSTNWTDYFDRKDMVNSANLIINELIQEIYMKKLPVHVKYNLTLHEIGVLYRWLIYVAVNTFIDRLLRSQCEVKQGVTKDEVYMQNEVEYYLNSSKSVFMYYYDFSLNAQILNNISSVLNGFNPRFEDEDFQTSIQKDGNIEKQNIKKYNLINNSNRIISRLREKYSLLREAQLTKTDVLYDQSKWLNLIFSKNSRIIKMPYDRYPIDVSTRINIKELSKRIFKNLFPDIIEIPDKVSLDKLSSLFSCWVDNILPFSIIEGLDGRFKFYRKLLVRKRIKELHTTIGLLYNDNYKVLSILAKRCGAIIIGHDHGVNNFVKYFHNGNDIVNFYKGLNQLEFMDYYFTWGINIDGKIGDAWEGIETKINTKVVNAGSVYLSTLEKWNKHEIDLSIMTLFYFCGPLRDYMANLEEIAPEINFSHRKKTLNFIKRLMLKYSGLQVIYKPFPGMEFRNDPFMDVFSEKIDQGKVKLTDKHPTELMPNVDVVLFDMISTGFAEAVQIGVPAVVYSNNYDYEIASKEGKRINDELEDSGVIFYDDASGLKSFDRVVNDLISFQESSKNPIRRFQEAIAYPIDKREFRRNLIKAIYD